MDRIVVAAKLDSLRRCVRRVEMRRAQSAEALAGDPDAQDILTLNLSRAVQLCVDIATHVTSSDNESPPGTMAESFDRLVGAGVIDGELAQRMRAAVGFRNIATHNYQAIDWRIVHAISHERLVDFAEFARRVSAAVGLT